VRRFITTLIWARKVRIFSKVTVDTTNCLHPFPSRMTSSPRNKFPLNSVVRQVLCDDVFVLSRWKKFMHFVEGPFSSNEVCSIVTKDLEMLHLLRGNMKRRKAAKKVCAVRSVASLRPMWPCRQTDHANTCPPNFGILLPLPNGRGWVTRTLGKSANCCWDMW